MHTHSCERTLWKMDTVLHLFWLDVLSVMVSVVSMSDIDLYH